MRAGVRAGVSLRGKSERWRACVRACRRIKVSQGGRRSSSRGEGRAESRGVVAARRGAPVLIKVSQGGRRSSSRGASRGEGRGESRGESRGVSMYK